MLLDVGNFFLPGQVSLLCLPCRSAQRTAAFMRHKTAIFINITENLASVRKHCSDIGWLIRMETALHVIKMLLRALQTGLGTLSKIERRYNILLHFQPLIKARNGLFHFFCADCRQRLAVLRLDCCGELSVCLGFFTGCQTFAYRVIFGIVICLQM